MVALCPANNVGKIWLMVANSNHSFPARPIRTTISSTPAPAPTSAAPTTTEPSSYWKRFITAASAGSCDIESPSSLLSTVSYLSANCTALASAAPKLDQSCPSIQYIHRSLKDGEVYFFFNEYNDAQTRTVTLVGAGQVTIWDAASGEDSPRGGREASAPARHFAGV